MFSKGQQEVLLKEITVLPKLVYLRLFEAGLPNFALSGREL